MTTGTVAGVRDFIRKVFPERQIYHRSNGTVHFTVLGPATQIALTCLLFVFLGWVAYASVNVVFKDQIIAAKDARFVSMQKAYESRISKQQLAYDELNGLLTLAEEKFSTSTNELEAKFRQLEGMVAQNRMIEEKRAELDTRLETLAGREYLLPPLPRSLSEAMEGEQEEAAPEEQSGAGGPYIPASAPEADQRSYLAPSEELVRHAKKNYTAQQLVTVWNRQNNLRGKPISMMETLLRQTQPYFAEQELMINNSGLRVDEIVKAGDVAEAAGDETGQGGPFVSLVGGNAMASETTGDLNYDQLSTNLTSRLDAMSGLQSVLDVMPLALPLRTANRLSSGFGPRLDPFTKRWAFHAGLDFSGEYGIPVLATSPGIVVQAEKRGPYGNMVEIEHDSGFRTRYGHLKSISVVVGDNVEFQQEVGKVGSTGRSTGPHLHYEIWYEGKVRDPRNFLKVGRYVFEKQG
jgi:murein DD-endopeptidase MepM/ murein hydrolase activator NlpD